MSCEKIDSEFAQTELDFTFNLLLSMNEGRLSDSTKSQLISEQETWKNFITQKCSREVETRTGRGATSPDDSVERARQEFDCLSTETEKRIEELISTVGVPPLP